MYDLDTLNQYSFTAIFKLPSRPSKTALGLISTGTLIFIKPSIDASVAISYFRLWFLRSTEINYAGFAPARMIKYVFANDSR